MLLLWKDVVWLVPLLQVCCGEDRMRSFPLGLSNGFIKSEQLSASSSANDAIFSPSHARLNAFSPWCGGYIGPGQWQKEWLQVDFRQQVTLTGVALRGSRFLQEKDHHVTSFYLLYSDSQISSSFRVLEDKLGKPHVFLGVSNSNDPIFRWLPTPIITRFVRFRAKSLKNGNKETAKVCAGLEFFGKMEADIGCKSTYALGMESGGISDSQLSASSSKFYTTIAKKARLNRAGKLAWCAASTSASEWLQIDLGFPVVITGFIVQGDGHGDCISKYIAYIGNSTSAFQEIRSPDGSIKTFEANSGETTRDPVLTLLENTVIARYVRLSPQALGKHSQEFCMRVEVLGYHPDGLDELLLYDQAMFWEGYSNAVTRMLYTTLIIMAGNAYCLNSALGPKPFLQIELTKPYVIAGVSMQGAMTSRSWVKRFQLWYGTEGKLMALFNETFRGNKDQITIVHRWFSEALTTNLVRVVALTWEMAPCFRVQLHGVYDGSKLKVETGGEISLHCPSRSCPKHRTTWYRNNIVLDEHKESLKIPAATREDDGLYYCIASNAKGSQISPIFYLQVLSDGDCSHKTYPCKPGYECVLLNSTYTCQCKTGSQTNLCTAMQTKEEHGENKWKLILIGGGICAFFIVAILITFVILYCRRSGRFSPYDRNTAGQRRSKDLTDGKYTERDCLTNVENNNPKA